MALRNGHGAGAGVPRIEVLPPDEQPAPVPVTTAPVRRREDGTVADSASAKALGARGGVARAHKARLVAGLGFSEMAEDAAFRPFQQAASEFHRVHVEVLASMAGGVCGPAPATMVATAALQLAASRFLFERGASSGDVGTLKAASALGDSSRQNLLAAYELAVREAEARSKAPSDAHAALAAALRGGGS